MIRQRSASTRCGRSAFRPHWVEGKAVTGLSARPWFHVPIDQCERGQIERGVRAHQQPEAPGGCINPPEDQPDDHRLLNAGRTLFRIMSQAEQGRGNQDDCRVRAHP